MCLFIYLHLDMKGLVLQQKYSDVKFGLVLRLNVNLLIRICILHAHYALTCPSSCHFPVMQAVDYLTHCQSTRISDFNF